MRNKPGGLLAILMLALGGMACVHHNEGMPVPSVICPVDTITAVAFVKDIQPLLQANCALSGCHSGSNASGKLDLDSAVAYANLWKPGTGYIDTLYPQASLLYSQMINATSPMPPSGRLDDCKTELILKWLQQKAR